MRRFRVSISGMMWVVAASALGIAALRDASGFSLGLVFLLTRAFLGLAIVRAIYRRGADRAWWLGFALFGWGYELLVPPASRYSYPHMPAASLLFALKPLFGLSAEIEANIFHEWAGKIIADYAYMRIGDDLMAMMTALLGAVLARRAFERSSAGSEPEPPPKSEPAARVRWFLPTAAIGAGLVTTTALLAMRSTGPSDVWAGLAFLFTSGLLGLAAVGAFQARGRLRRTCAGAAILGGGYLLLVFSQSPYRPMPLGQFLHAFRVWFPVIAGPTASTSARILDELERPIPMEFPRKTPLSEVVASLKKSTSTPDNPGIPIYVDPIGLQEADHPPDPKITIELGGVPLKVALRAALEPIDMDYVVQDGVLWITSSDSGYSPFDEALMQDDQHRGLHRRANLALAPDLEDPYLVAGHCLLAMLAMGLGAIAGSIPSGATGPHPEDRP